MSAKALLKEIPIDLLKPGRYQMRRDFDETALQELAQSIQAQGLIQPIVVRPTHTEIYEIIAGERRWRASQKIGLEKVSCLIHHFTDEQAAAVATIENIQRQDLNPIEEATGYQQLIDEFHYEHEHIAVIVGVSRTKISNSLRLLRLDDRVQQFLIEKQLSEGHGKILAGLAFHHQYAFASKCIDQRWSVRQLELEAKKIQDKIEKNVSQQDPDIARLERSVSDQFGSTVKFEQDAQKQSGWIKIRYFDYDTLAGLLEKMGIQKEE